MAGRFFTIWATPEAIETFSTPVISLGGAVGPSLLSEAADCEAADCEAPFWSFHYYVKLSTTMNKLSNPSERQ